MTIYTIDPLSDTRWRALLEKHIEASVFHTPEWLMTLKQTYGYEPIVYTTSRANEELMNGIVFCRIKSWLTGRRLVSVPFSDFCQPLINQPEELQEYLSHLKVEREKQKWRYVELRPLDIDRELIDETNQFRMSDEYFHSRLDLTPNIEDLFNGFHKTSIRAKIRRATRVSYDYERGTSNKLLQEFYRLQVLTRRKHQLPPQPLKFFRNLIDSFGENLDIHLISLDGQPVASIMTILFKRCLFWKYSCSNARLDRFGVTRLLVWNSIQQAKMRGAISYDMGRSEQDNKGLISFKDRFGSKRSCIYYYRYPFRKEIEVNNAWKMRIAKKVFSRIPKWLLIRAGALIYKHIA